MNPKNPIPISVGIPAYNESKNIAALVQSVLSQEGETFTLNEVIVVSDGSTDNTVSEALSVRDNRVRVIDSKQRRGKTMRCNEIFDIFTGDLLLQFDGDVHLPSNSVIEEMVRLLQQNDYGFVCGNLVPAAPNAFVQRLAFFGLAIWGDILDELGPDKTMLHHCIGGARLFTREVLRNFRFPTKVETGEDVYTYFTLLNNGVRIGFAPSAIVNYKLPATFADYVRQMHRFLATGSAMSADFGKKAYEEQNLITAKVKLLAYARRLFTTNPIISIGYACIQIYARLTMRGYKRTKLWDIASSTK